MASKSAADLENQSTAPNTHRTAQETGRSLQSSQADAVREEQGRPRTGSLTFSANEQDCMTYDQDTLLSWRILLHVQGTAMDNASLRTLFFQMLFVATCVATSCCLMMKNANDIDTSRFARLTTFLNTFLGLMLGFFLTMQMKRWFASVGAFMSLFDAVRNLQCQCFGLGVAREQTSIIVRYGLLSAWLLYYECVGKCEGYDSAKIWKTLEETRPSLMEPLEKEKLRKVGEPSSCIWTWVASLVGRMAQDGDIPPMPSPTYARILGLAQSAHASIRNVRSNVVVQAPFIYTHMLVTLIHCNNIMNAIYLGLTLGVNAAVIRHEGLREFDASKVAQDAAVAVLMSLSAPLLYQAILEVSVAIAQPFSLTAEDGLIPVPKLLTALEHDLNDAAKLADSPPSWQKPAFKKPKA